MPDIRASRREWLAGGLIALFGAAAFLEGRRLGVGTLPDMGPGFVPTSLGVLLIGLGPIIALTGHHHPADDAGTPHMPDARGALCILLGAAGFILLGQHAGLAPATFCSVFVAAIGDRTTTPRQALFLALGVTLFGCLLFGTVLKSPIPILGVR